MEFKDFKDNPQELVGKTVLWEIGQSYSDNKNFRIRKIVKVTKTGFRIEDTSNALFSLEDGWLKGLRNKINRGTVSVCKLITEEEEINLREQWRIKRETDFLRVKMQEKLKTMNLEQLKKMELL